MSKAHIVHRYTDDAPAPNGEYVVVNAKGKVIGGYMSEDDAKARLHAVEHGSRPWTHYGSHREDETR